MKHVAALDDFQPSNPARRLVAALLVLALHALLAWTLMMELPRPQVPTAHPPLRAQIIQAVTLPPPPAQKPEPPPKPKVLPKAPPKPAPVLQALAPPTAAAPAPLPPLPFVPAPEQAINQAAPAMAATTQPPAAPPVVAAPAPPSPPAPRQASIGVACPRQVAPEMPRQALREGIEGVVQARIHIRAGRVTEVHILSGPRVFHAAVRAAILQYECSSDANETIATQSFQFKFE
ncbi:MAG: hypothetical protein Fur007_14470 [Rhodoferax sp.]